MSLIRSPEQTKLAELQAIGAGMLLRYEALQDHDAQSLIDIVRRSCAKRRALLAALADAAKLRGDIPSAGDHEVNEFHALADRLLATLFGEETLYQRVAQAEESWRAALDDALDMDWRSDERRLVQALRDESRDTRQALETLAG